jgi:hypothetical protein
MAARQWIPSPHGWTFESRFFFEKLGYSRNSAFSLIEVILSLISLYRTEQGPQGRVVPSRGCTARPDVVGYVLQSAAPTGPSP